MSRFAFEIPSEAKAIEFPDWRREKGMYQTDLYADAISCRRRLMPVSSPAERVAAKLFVPEPAFPCDGCGQFAFSKPGVRCFWCKADDAKWAS